MLRQLMIAKQIEQRKNALAELAKQEESFKVRSQELEAAIEEAQTDEEVDTVTQEVEKLEAEQAELKEKKTKLEEEIAELEGELDELKAKEPDNTERKKGVEKMEKRELRDLIGSFVRTKGRMLREDPPAEPELVGFKIVDGGVLIPEEILAPEKEKRDVVDLSKYVRIRKVNRGSGKVPLLKKSGSRLYTVDELEKNPELAKPSVEDVDYSIDTYRGYVPISQEVIDDADYDIVGLVAEDMADQELNTKNAAIAAILKTAPAVSYTGTGENKTADTVVGLDGLKEVLNTKLKKVYNAKLFVSASLYHQLDIAKDKNGRYLLQDSITSASGKSFAGREVIVLDDDVIGETAGDLVAFVGDAYEFVTLFDRKQMSAKWVDMNIYGELLGIFVRFDAVKFDEAAGYYFEWEPEPEDDGLGEG
jgi:HK97 family phage major capsid protein